MVVRAFIECTSGGKDDTECPRRFTRKERRKLDMEAHRDLALYYANTEIDRTAYDNDNSSP